LLAEVLTATLNGMNREPNFRFVYFFQAKELTKNRGVFGTFPWFIDEGLGKGWIASDPLLKKENEDSVLYIEYVFFYRDAKITHPDEITSLEKLKKLVEDKGLSMGGVEDYTYRPEVDKMIRGNRFGSELTAFRKLFEKNGIDIVPASRRVGQHLIDVHFADKRHLVGILGEGDLSTDEHTVHFLMRNNPENQNLMKQFNESLKKVKDSSLFEELKERYDTRQDYQRVVRLTGTDSFPIVVGTKTKTEKTNAFVIPNRTRAIVLEWGTRFLEAGPVSLHEHKLMKSKVRLLEGPLKGEILYVHSLYINFE
jgi:polar amino acid transport system substrate-binding protein